MKLCKRILCLLLVLCLLAVVPVSARAREDVSPYIQRMIQYYLHYRQAADTEIESLLDYIESVDPGQGSLWREIMADWRWSNEEMTVNRDLLPDGLSQDDSLCIVILGFGLNDDGSMKEELVDRLVVGLASALKYPNAYICVTGGATAAYTRDTEADRMGDWLVEKGVESHRVIRENRSLSTTENARNVYALLREAYPQVDSIAVVSSDYHIPWGVSMFTTVSNYESYYGGGTLEVVGNAANTTGNTWDTMHSQAWGISIIADLPFDANAVPAMYATETTVETLPAAEPQVAVVERERKPLVLPAVLIGLAVVILLIPSKKKEKKK